MSVLLGQGPQVFLGCGTCFIGAHSFVAHSGRGVHRLGNTGAVAALRQGPLSLWGRGLRHLLHCSWVLRLWQRAPPLWERRRFGSRASFVFVDGLLRFGAWDSPTLGTSGPQPLLRGGGGGAVQHCESYVLHRFENHGACTPFGQGLRCFGNTAASATAHRALRHCRARACGALVHGPPLLGLRWVLRCFGAWASTSFGLGHIRLWQHWGPCPKVSKARRCP